MHLCRARLEEPLPRLSRIVTSDDVFGYMLDIRVLNEGSDRGKERLFDEHYEARHPTFKVRSFKDYEELKKRVSAHSKTQSSFIREPLMENVREQSNGESAVFHLRRRIESDAVYLGRA